MKKFLVLLLAFAMIISVTACGSKPEESDPQGTDQPGSETDGPGTGAMVVNPWKVVSADELEAYLGYRFGVPKEAKDVVYRWDESDGLAEMQFKDGNGVEICARAKKTGSLEDISGLYYEFSSDNYGNGADIYITNNDRQLRGDLKLYKNDSQFVNLGLWYYECSEGSYSFSISAVTDAFIDMHQDEVFPLENQGDPMEYSREYWEKQYPDKNICPFYIQIGDKEYPYYLVMGMGCAMSEWISTPFNWNGWHKVGNDIVNKDETVKMTVAWAADDSGSLFSSFCTVTTEPYVPADSAGQTDPVAQTGELAAPVMEWWELYNPNGFDTVTALITNPNDVAIDVSYDLVFLKDGQEVTRLEYLVNFSILPGEQNVIFANDGVPSSSDADEVRMEKIVVTETIYTPVAGKSSYAGLIDGRHCYDVELEAKPSLATIWFIQYNDENKNGKFDKGEIVVTGIDYLTEQSGQVGYDADVFPSTDCDVVINAF